MAKETYIRTSAGWRKPKDIFVRTADGWRRAKEGFVRTAAGWTKIWPNVPPIQVVPYPMADQLEPNIIANILYWDGGPQDVLISGGVGPYTKQYSWDMASGIGNLQTSAGGGGAVRAFNLSYDGPIQFRLLCTVVDQGTGLTHGPFVSPLNNGFWVVKATRTDPKRLKADYFPANSAWAQVSPGVFEATVSVRVTATSGGTAPYTKTWTPYGFGPITVVSEAVSGIYHTAVVRTSDPREAVISCWIVAANGFRTRVNCRVREPAALAASIQPSAAQWSGSEGQYTALLICQPTGGAAPYTFFWSIIGGPGAEVISGQESASCTVSQGTRDLASVACQVRDSTGATVTAQRMVQGF